MKLDVMRVPSCKSHVRYCYIYTLHIIRQSMAQIWGQTSEHINQVLSRGTTHDAQPWSHDAPSRIVEVEKRVAHLIQWKELYNTDHMYSMIRTWNGVQYLSKRSFLNDYHSWSCGIFYPMYWGAALHAPNPRCYILPIWFTLAFGQVAKMQIRMSLPWSSYLESIAKGEGNNQLEHMARSNEGSYKTHIVIIIQGDCFNIYNMP